MGATQGIKTRCFVLAATNCDLAEDGASQQFSEALFRRFAQKQVDSCHWGNAKRIYPIW